METYKQEILKEYNKSTNKMNFINNLKQFIYDILPKNKNPVDLVKWIPIEKIVANDYNPNNVNMKELELLYVSIQHDGYTQPIVTIYDKEKDQYIIVDGFHRYFVEKTHQDLCDKNYGRLPVTIIEKDINDRMASTIRHNRARGKHSVTGMSNVVFTMLDNGWSDSKICKELGMEPEEIIRLKHITGFSKLFENVEYKKAWVTRKQLALQKEWNEKQ